MKRLIHLFLDLCKKNFVTQFIMIGVIMITTFLCLVSVNCFKQYTDYVNVLKKCINSGYVTYSYVFFDNFLDDFYSLEGNEYIDDLVLSDFYSVDVGSKELEVICYDEWFEKCSDYKIKGRLPINPNEIAIAKSESNGFEIGDVIKCAFCNADYDLIKVELKIVGFIDIYNTIDPTSGGGDIIYHAIDCDWSLASKDIKDINGVPLSEAPVVKGIIKLKDNVDFNEALYSIKRSVRHPAYVSDYNATYEDYTTLKHLQLVQILSLFAVSISLMFVVIVAKSVFMFYSQKRSLYIKHILGASIIELTGINLLYEFVISFAGFILGNVMYILNTVIENDLIFWDFKNDYNALIVIVTFLIVMGFTLLASLPYYVKLRSDEMIYE